MAYERLWPAVTQPFSSNGTIRGTFKVSDYTGFFVKQQVVLKSNTQPDLSGIEIKRIDPDGTIYVGIPGNITNRIDVSAFLLADDALVSAAEQQIPFIKPDEITNFEYERDPVKAKRVIPVDTEGTPYGKDNPIPVDADVTINSVALFTMPYDSLDADLTGSTTDIYTSYIHGYPPSSGLLPVGTLVQTVTINYTDSTKNYIKNVYRTPLS